MALGRLDVPGWSSTAARSTRASYNGPAQRDRRDRLRGDRRLPGRQDHARRAVRGRERRLPGPGRVRRPVHGQHDEHGPGVHRPLAGRPQRHPGRGPGQGRRGPADRRAGHGPRPPRRPAVVDRDPRRRSRTRSPRWRRPAARPTACCTCWPSPTSSASRSTSTSSATIADRTPIVADMQPGRPLHRDRPVRRGRRRARHARAAQAAGPAPRRRADGRRPDDRRDRAPTAVETPGQQVVRPDRDAGQADRRPGDPARLARARRLRRQAGRPRAPPAPRPGPRLRLGGGLLRGGPRPADRARRRRRHPLRGPGRRARDAGDAERHRRPRRRGPRRLGRAASPTAGSPAARTA